MDEAKNATKSENLLFIRDYITKSFVEDIIVFTVEDYMKDKGEIINSISSDFKGDKIIVRSSFRNAAKNIYSKTGRYKSVIGIKSDDFNEVDKAVSEIINSYLDDSPEEEKLRLISNEQILVQRLATDIVMIGNVYTRDLLFNRPYYVINYTDKISIGKKLENTAGNLKWIAKNVSREFVDERFYKLIEAVKEIEGLYEGTEALEIEFAIDCMGNIIIFQLRQLYRITDRPGALSDHEFYDTKSFAKCIYLDDYHVLSDMACFGLAENLGTNPRPLDYSLYRELITGSVWSEALSSLGYYKVDKDVMQKIGNKPYVSVDLLFEGLTPSTIDSKLRYKLKEYYIDKLNKNKELHSRIDTEIAIGVCAFTLDERFEELREYGFNEQEIFAIRKSLFDITKNMICNYPSLASEDKKHIEELVQIRREIRSQNPLSENNAMKLYGYISKLLEAIKEHGTKQFIRHSRCSLVTMVFCNSMVEKGYLSREEVADFLGTIDTRALQFERDFDSYSEGRLSLEDFDKQYGHMRMGAFDIRTESYRAMYKKLSEEEYLEYNSRVNKEAYSFDREKIQKALYNTGFNIEADVFVRFLQYTIINREDFRFEIIKALCLILEMIARLGDTMGIAREDMSYLEINDLLSYHSRETYIQDISLRRAMYYANKYLMLPEVIFGVGDIDVITQMEQDAFYVSDKIVEAEVVDLKDNEQSDVSGKIVALSSPNSAYNWIFTRKIAGFVTKYGRSDSYMTKRCMELGIPAVIGCGERIYGKLVNMERVRLGCANKKIVEL